MRAREARSSSSRAGTSACRRSFSSASRAAALTSSTSCSSSSRPGACSEHRYGAPLADEVRALLVRGRLDGTSACVHEAAGLLERIGEDQIGVADDLGEHVSQAARRSRLHQIDDEPGNRRARATASYPAPTHAESDRDEGGCLGEPQAPLERAVRDQSAPERGREHGRRQAKVHGARGDDRPCRTWASRELQSRECRKSDRPREPDVDPDSSEIVGERTPVADEHEVLRAPEASAGLRVEEERRQDAEDEHAADVPKRNHRSLRLRPESSARIREDGVGDERRTRGVEAKPDREGEGRADPGVVPLRQEPGEAGGREQRAEVTLRPTQPEDEPTGDQRPAGREQRSASDDRRAGEPVAGILARNVEGERADGDPQAGDPEHHKRAAPHR